MAESFNLPILRAWCRKKDAWLCFWTRAGDRYFINPYGYYVELPDGRLSQITARVAFPLVNCYPSVLLSDIEVQSGFGSAAYFVYALRQGEATGPPEAIRLSQLRLELDAILPYGGKLSPPERYIAVRVLEQGLLSEEQLADAISNQKQERTFAQDLLDSQLCTFEVLLGACMDVRTSAQLDPPTADRRTFLREWELAGEILIAMGKITRSKLEYALRIKKEASRTSGEILTAIGACLEEDVDQCLAIQNGLRQSRGREVGLIGDLLVRQGLISQEELLDALGRQRISGRPLSQVLVSMGYCRQSDIEAYKTANGWHSFQGEIEDSNLASWLLTKKIVSEQQIEQAIRVKGQGRQMLGQILVASGLCSQLQVDEVLDLQKSARVVAIDGTGIEKIGSLLLSQGKIDRVKLEEATRVQQRGRKALGEVLQAVGGCSQAAIDLALEIQRVWREKMDGTEDRLGEVLQRRGFLSPSSLEQAMSIQESTNRPIGRVLVENNLCTPEEIIATLLMRDYKRQCDLNIFIRKSLQLLSDAEISGGAITERMLLALLEKAVL